MYPLKKALVNKAGLLASALIALLVITSCSDSGTSTTGITPLSRDAADAGAINNATLKKEDNGEHSDTDPGHSHSPDQQHGEAGNVVTSTTVLALAAIPTSTCGNFIQEAGEQCDAGLSGDATCTANCTLKEGRGGEIVAENFCGDGTRDAGEQCDDGNSNNTDSCTQYCKLAVCGDGYTQPSNGEQCDDKNKVDSDGCSNACQKQGTTATLTATGVTATPPTTPDNGNTYRTTTTTDTPNQPDTRPDICPKPINFDDMQPGPAKRALGVCIDRARNANHSRTGDLTYIENGEGNAVKTGTYLDVLHCDANCIGSLVKSSAECINGWSESAYPDKGGWERYHCYCEHDYVQADGSCALKMASPEEDKPEGGKVATEDASIVTDATGKDFTNELNAGDVVNIGNLEFEVDVFKVANQPLSSGCSSDDLPLCDNMTACEAAGGGWGEWVFGGGVCGEP